MRFLANTGVSPASVHYLRHLGREVLQVHEQGLDRMADSESMSRACNVNLHLLQILEQHAGELERGVAISVAKDHLRVRHLPI